MVALMYHLTEYRYSQSFYEYKYHHLNIFYVLCYNVIVSQSCLCVFYMCVQDRYSEKERKFQE